MLRVRPLLMAGCAVVLLGLCGVAGASATNSPEQDARVPYSSRELVLDHGRLRAEPLGTDLDAHAAAATPTPPTAPAAPATGAADSRGLSFVGALAQLAQRGEIPAASAAGYRSAWTGAQASERRLSGTRHAELGAVLATLRAIARAGALTPGRLPALMLTLERNQQWWTSAPVIAADQRVGFPGSSLVWEFYPGEGLEIQWLGTFGAADGFYDDHQSANLANLINEALSLAVTRAGGLAWEYDFRFDGGSPPWVSAITEGTAVEALTGAATMLHDSVYLADAHDALGVFEAKPPLGVRSPTSAGAWYLIYSFAPHERVINAFIQSLIGLFDLAYQGDSLAQQLFTSGNDEARLALPGYNTGYWSLYDQYGESNLSYHELLTGFLQTLCSQTRETTAQALGVLGSPAPGTPNSGASGSGGTVAPGSTGNSGVGGATGTSGATGASSATGGSGSTGTSGATGASGSTGTSGATGTSGGTGSTGTTTNPNEIYCTTAAAFKADLKQPPQIVMRPVLDARAKRVSDIRFTLSKISDVSLSATYDGKTSSYGTLQLGHGTHTFTWRPSKPGSWTLALTAVDLAGNRSMQSEAVSVAAAAEHAKLSASAG
jgi:hypothetical protein